MRYFAFGSNMFSARLRARVGEFPQGAAAQLPGYALKFHKRGGDGSAKCDAVATHDPNRILHGVVYRLTAAQRTTLDGFEGDGYSTLEIRVAVAGDEVPAYMYVACPDHVDATLLPFRWYKQLVLAGAKEFLLPKPHLQQIAQVAAVPDPDRARHEKNLTVFGRPQTRAGGG